MHEIVLKRSAGSAKSRLPRAKTCISRGVRTPALALGIEIYFKRYFDGILEDVCQIYAKYTLL